MSLLAQESLSLIRKMALNKKRKSKFSKYDYVKPNCSDKMHRAATKLHAEGIYISNYSEIVVKKLLIKRKFDNKFYETSCYKSMFLTITIK